MYKALEVDGTFDDCQRMVKQAFLDTEMTRDLCAVFCKFYQYSPPNTPKLLLLLVVQPTYAIYSNRYVCSVPSGNFGNLMGGLMAQSYGTPHRKVYCC